jgi:hypothetical protein
MTRATRRASFVHTEKIDQMMVMTQMTQRCAPILHRRQGNGHAHHGLDNNAVAKTHCPACGSLVFWPSRTGRKVCVRCHPDPPRV